MARVEDQEILNRHIFLENGMDCRELLDGILEEFSSRRILYRETAGAQLKLLLGRLLRERKLDPVLIVTDRGLVETGLAAHLEQVLERAGVSCFVYADTRPNPTVDNVEQALKAYHAHGCRGLVALGGGSAMDCAKAVGARVAYPGRTVRQLGGILKVWRRLPPLAAIPTTAGTGSETTLAALVTEPETGRKYALMSFPLIPEYAVLDPELTFSLPPHLTAATGMDALTHAVEAYLGRSTTKQTRRWALETVELVFGSVERAYRDGRDRQARENMLHAAYRGGLVLSRSYVGYIHAVAHSLGGRYNTPHGLANAVIMPRVLEAYGPSVHKKLRRLAVAAGVANEADNPKQAAEAFIAAVRDLNARMGIPDKLTGIRPEDVPALAAHAEREANPLYPVPVLMTRKQLERFYEQIAQWSEQT